MSGLTAERVLAFVFQMFCMFVHCHTVRGTKPGEEAAGGAVMAVREAGFSPFPFLQTTGTHRNRKAIEKHKI